MAKVMAGDQLRAWSQGQAEEFGRETQQPSAYFHNVNVKLLAARIAAAYLIGATHALNDETERILEARSRPVRTTAPAQRVGEAGAKSEPDATGFSGAPQS